MKHHGKTTPTATSTSTPTQTICLFRKYLLNKKLPQQPYFHKQTSPPPNFPTNLTRPLSFLERKLLINPTTTRFDGHVESSGDDIEKPSTAQLTIFYDGAVSVYENVSIDKAKAIMILAGENSFPMPSKMLSTNKRSTQLSACTLSSNFPMARKISLQHFIEKRKNRLKNKYAYAPPTRKEKDHNASN